MNSAALIQVLDIVYQTDLAKLTEFKNQQAALEEKRARLQAPLHLNQMIEESLELGGASSRHLVWRRNEVQKFSRMIFELQPAIANAKVKLKKSFGRLEAVRELKNLGHF
jgi:predicted RNase H-like nuclease (RuvC/YqgF family)